LTPCKNLSSVSIYKFTNSAMNILKPVILSNLRVMIVQASKEEVTHAAFHFRASQMAS